MDSNDQNNSKTAGNPGPFRFSFAPQQSAVRPSSAFPAPVFGSGVSAAFPIRPAASEQPALFGMNINSQPPAVRPAGIFGNKPRPQFTFGARPANPQFVFGAAGNLTSPVGPSAAPATEKAAPASSEQNANDEKMTDLRTIVCFGVPDEFNNKLDLLTHFRKFGNVTRIFPNVKKQTATVQFDNHDSAAMAKQSGTQFRPNVMFKIFWKQPSVSANKNEKPKNPQTSGEDVNPAENNEEENEEDTKPRANTNSGKLPLKSRQSSPPRKAAIAAVNLDEGVPLQIGVDELKLILQKPALTAPERTTVLDARDRLTRIMKERNKTVSSSNEAITSLKGTCPDMCPEKERYMRVEKRRLASYEMAHSQDYDVDHRLAVKEYSRSSADQAEPLSHELRPLPVLQMTFDYLVTAIVNKCEDPEENLGEWFNFLWDRTRGIRKDLTQQSICDPGAVDLVEKCARFHIHCTARLCELDMQDFDQKINDENLTKCLQTLKHMYYDLSLQGIACLNEAEFRAYDILLHFNDGDILRQAQQWDARVRGSWEVERALQLFSAVNSRNYVRFFKLTRSNDDYLQCCLLQRYFQQVRSTAMQIMVQAYGPPRKGQIPLSNLVDLLGFEDFDEALTWCQNHGLSLDDREMILLDKTLFSSVPEQQPLRRRSFQLIENKRKVSPGEIVQKGSLPPNPALSHKPHNSFEEGGVLRKEAWYAEDQSGVGDHQSIAATGPPEKREEPAPAYRVPASFRLEAKPPVIGLPPEKREEPEPAYRIPPTFLIEQTVSLIGSQILEEMTRDFVREICGQSLREICLAHAMFGIMEAMIKEEIASICNETRTECVREAEERRAVEARRRIEKQKNCEIISNELFSSIVNDVVNSELRLSSIDAIAEAERKEHCRFQEEIAKLTLNAILDEVAAEETESTATVVAREAIRQREFPGKVETLLISREVMCSSRQNVELADLGVFKWELLVSQVKSRILELRLRRCITQWRRYSTMKIKKQNDMMAFPAFPSNLHLEKQVVLLKTKGEGPVLKRKSVSQLMENPKRINLLSDLQYTISSLSMAVENSTLNIIDLLDKQLKISMEKEKYKFWKLVLADLNPRSTRTAENIRRFFGLKSAKASDHGWVCTEKRSVAICIRYLSVPEVSSKVLEHLRGTNCLMVIADWNFTSEKLLEKLTDHLSSWSNVQICKILCSRTDPEILEGILQPQRTLVADLEEGSTSELLKGAESVLWAANQTTRSMPRDLLVSGLSQLADSLWTSAILPVIYGNLRNRLKYRLLHQPIDVLVSIHNEAVDYLSNLIDDPDCSSVPWPAAELCTGILEHLNDWNKPIHRAKASYRLREFLNLPQFPILGGSWDEICEQLIDFCCSEVSIPGIDSTAFLSRINCILHKTQQEFQDLVPGGEPELENLPWTFIYQACLDYRLECLSTSDLLAGCFSSQLKQFKISANCFHALSWNSYTGAVTLDETLERASSTLTEKNNRKSPTIKIQESRGTQIHDPQILKLTDQLMEESLLSQAEDSRFENLLKKALQQEAVAEPEEVVTEAGSEIPEAEVSSVDHLLQKLETSLYDSRTEEVDYERYLQRLLK